LFMIGTTVFLWQFAHAKMQRWETWEIGLKTLPIWARTDRILDGYPFLELCSQVFDFCFEVLVILRLFCVSHVLHFEICLQIRHLPLPSPTS